MEEFLKVIHKVVDFLLGTVPVFGRKGIKTHDLDVEFAASLKDLNDSFAGFMMSKMSWQATKVGPSAVSIHNEGDVVEFFGKFKILFLSHSENIINQNEAETMYKKTRKRISA